ncbi:MAG: hypothetical protein ACR2PF_13425 [Rhizobiaceae bacterium]
MGPGGVKLVLAVAAICFAEPALAYIGPGAGITAIGSALALVVGALAVIAGFVWYPVKRLLRSRSKAKTPQNVTPSMGETEKK